MVLQIGQKWLLPMNLYVYQSAHDVSGVRGVRGGVLMSIKLVNNVL